VTNLYIKFPVLCIQVLGLPALVDVISIVQCWNISLPATSLKFWMQFIYLVSFEIPPLDNMYTL